MFSNLYIPARNVAITNILAITGGILKENCLPDSPEYYGHRVPMFVISTHLFYLAVFKFFDAIPPGFGQLAEDVAKSIFPDREDIGLTNAGKAIWSIVKPMISLSMLALWSYSAFIYQGFSVPIDEIPPELRERHLGLAFRNITHWAMG